MEWDEMVWEEGGMLTALWSLPPGQRRLGIGAAPARCQLILTC